MVGAMEGDAAQPMVNAGYELESDCHLIRDTRAAVADDILTVYLSD